MMWIFDNLKKRLNESRYNPSNWITKSGDIVIKNYDGEEVGTVSPYAVARNITLDQFTSLFDKMINSRWGREEHGYMFGLNLTRTHRTLQGSAIMFLIGALVALADQDHTDARNETAVATAKKMVAVLEDKDYQRLI